MTANRKRAVLWIAGVFCLLAFAHLAIDLFFYATLREVVPLWHFLAASGVIVLCGMTFQSGGDIKGAFLTVRDSVMLWRKKS